ncbi:MAG TPA: hypothetical protein VNI84_00250 [Pyrinomonadaceae bacterium]|nr:hypothetical protein [Pyrinomonadaceae bacterium]
MKKYSILLLIIIFSVNVFAQKDKKIKPSEKDTTASKDKNTGVISKTRTPLELAKATVIAYGGDKFKNMKTLVVRGTADVSGSPAATFPATFAMILSGDKYRLEVINSIQPFKQVYDGQQTSSSVNNFSLPPINRLGLPLLQRIEEKDFTVSALPEKSKKKNGFRVTAPEGFYTDFFIDEKTGLVKSYESEYEIRGRAITTSVEIDKVRDVEGVKIPERYAQRFDLGQLTIYANFKAKDILVNSTVADDIFVIGN